VLATIERARRAAAERRARAGEARRDYARFLEDVAGPVFRQVATVLRTHGWPFHLSTPGDAIRLASERSADDFIELALDTSTDEPLVMIRVSRTRGRRVVDSSRPLNPSRPVSGLGEEEVLASLLKELEPFVEK
jgi:hypothetical protein